MIPVRIKKVTRDIFKNAPRVILSILAVAIGTIGIGTVITAYSVLTREMNAGFRATSPAASALEAVAGNARIADASRLMSIVKSVPGVDKVEQRGLYRGRILTGKDEWKSIILFVIDDFSNMRLNSIKPETGVWPPKKGDILIERSAFPLSHTKINAPVTVEFPGIPVVRLNAAGIVHDAGQAPAWMENMVYGYINRETLALFGINSLNRLLFSVREDNENSESGGTVGDIHGRIKSWFASAGHEHNAIDRVSDAVMAAVGERGIEARLVASHAHDAGSVPKTGVHPHEGQMKSLLFLLGSFGALAFILSGITVFTLMSSMLAREVRAIGIMKAVGARTSDIGSMYFSGIFILACVALVPAIPAALFLADKYSHFAAGMLNFKIVNPDPPAMVIPVIVLLGLALPIVSAAIPVLRGMKLSVRKAMSDYGVSESKSTKESSRFSRFLTGPGAIFTLPIRNIIRTRARTLLTIIMLTAGGIIFIAALNTGASIKATMREIDNSYKCDVEVRLAKMLPAAEISRAFKLQGVKAVESWIDLTGCRMVNGTQEREFRILAIPFASSMINFPVIGGRWFRPGETNAVVVNQRWLVSEHGVNVGDVITMRINGRDRRVPVIGSIRMISASTAIVPYTMPEEISSAGLANSVRISSDIDTSALMRTINISAQKSKIPIAMMFSRSEYKKALDGHFVIIVSFLIIMALFIVVVGAIGLSSAMSVAVLERYREIGIMRAIGGSTRQILGLIITEGIIIGMISFVLAAALSGPVSMLIGTNFIRIFLQTSIDFAFAPSAIPVWFGLLMIITLFASLLPARRAAMLSVREAINYE